MNRHDFLKSTWAGIVGAWSGFSTMSFQPEALLSPKADNTEVPGWGYSRWLATGPLEANPANPSYFTDGSGRAIFLSGSHTWANFQDIGLPPDAHFDCPAYIDMMVKHNHNFMRFWHWMQAAYAPSRDEKILCQPLPYLRTGPPSDSPKELAKMRGNLAVESAAGVTRRVRIDDQSTECMDGCLIVGGRKFLCPNDTPG